MDASELGRRLKVAREARGLSQQAVADALRVPRTAVTQMEGGNRAVSTLELSRLAELYHRPVSALLSDQPQDDDEDVLVALHRIAPGLENDPVVREQVDRCVNLCREGVTLGILLGHDRRVGPPVYAVALPRRAGEAVAQGEQVAESERRRLGIGSAPIADVGELISGQGIWASGMQLPNDMSGLFLHHRSIGLAILVNALHARGRKRFSYAHEYAHALLDRDRTVTVSSTDNSAELVEKRANAFAASFLMPRNGVQEALRNLDKGQPSRQEQMVFDAATGGPIEAEVRPPARSQRITYTDVARVAQHFGVSYLAALYRLKSLGYLSLSELEGLRDDEGFGRDYLRALDMFSDVEEPEQKRYWDREMRGEIADLAIEAYRREEISRGRLLEISKTLNISGQLLLSLAEAAKQD